MRSVKRALKGIQLDPNRLSLIIRITRVQRIAAELRQLGHDDLAGQLEFYEHDILSVRNTKS